jgi:hypothetical protein
MFCKRETVTITTAADGTGTGYSNVVNGRILSVQYVKPTSGGFSDGVDFNITTETTGQTVLAKNDVNASAIHCPRQAVHSVAGVAANYADGYPVLEPVIVADERIKIQIAAGGSGGIGTFHITIG